MKCCKCGCDLEDPPGGRLSYRATCDKCHSWLHCCTNCKNFKIGAPNNCRIPGTEPIADRTSNNFCDEFSLLGTGPSLIADPKEVARRLFGD